MSELMEKDVAKVLFSEEEIARMTRQMGEKISADYADKNLLLVGVLKGANIFVADLARTIPEKVQMDFIVASSYGNSTVSSGQLRILKDVEGDLSDKDILLVEDLIDTGLTLKLLKEHFEARGAKSIRIATLLNKPDRREKQVTVDYVGFECPNEFVVGYGLDYAELYRNLPYIGVLKKEVYTT